MSGIKNPVDAKKIRVTRDVVYARHGVGFTTATPTLRDLKLDVYEPDAPVSAPRPAIVLAFGGAFHRGSKEADSFSKGEAHNTSAADYAAHWAALGFVAVCIDYRLIPEDPAPGSTRVLSSPGTVGPQRMNAARAEMGLPPASLEALANGVEAGSDDMAAAAAYVLANARQWNIDPSRVALWGWSAGARNALHAVLGEGVQPAALVVLSPYMHEDDLAQLVPSHRESPPALLVSAERDLPHIAEQIPAMVRHFQAHWPALEYALVEDADHFYPHDAKSVDASHAGIGLLERMTAFLSRHLRHPIP